MAMHPAGKPLPLIRRAVHEGLFDFADDFIMDIPPRSESQSHCQQQRLDDYNYMIFIQSHLPTFRQIKSLKVGRIMEEFNRYVYFTFLPSVV